MVLDRKRVALISVHGDPAIEIGKEEAGGQNVYVRHVGEALARLGWQVDMFSRKTDPEDATIVEHSPQCRTIRLTAGPEAFIPRDELFDRLPEFVEQFQAFQVKERIEYPIVHTNYWLSSWVGMELKRQQPQIRQVHTHHSLGAVKYKAVRDRPPIADTRLETEKRCIETADCVIATSPQEEEDMRSLVTKKGNIKIIPCGTDVDRFGSISQTEARQRLGFDPDDKIAFYVGRFDRRKGIETLVRAAAECKTRATGQLKLIIGGGSRPDKADGRERRRIEGIVEELELGDIASFPGRISDADLPAYFAAADVCVLPSHYEPFGLVPLEAMACWTPVIASKVGGLQYSVVHEATGLLVPPKDAAGFAKALDRVLGDSQWRDRLGKAARSRVENEFSWTSVAGQLAELYETLL